MNYKFINSMSPPHATMKQISPPISKCPFSEIMHKKFDTNRSSRNSPNPMEKAAVAGGITRAH